VQSSSASSGARLMALVVLVITLAAAHACYRAVSTLRAELLGPGLQRNTASPTP
jgi:hypothetical protein